MLAKVDPIKMVRKSKKMSLDELDLDLRPQLCFGRHQIHQQQQDVWKSLHSKNQY